MTDVEAQADKQTVEETEQLEESRATRAAGSFKELVTKMTTAQIFAAILGTLLVLFGVASLVTNFDFSTGNEIWTERLLFADVNGWSGLLNLLTGIALFLGSFTPKRARRATLVVGSIYLVLTIWSLFTATPATVFPVNDLVAICWAAIAVLGITAGLAPDPREN
jgi:uncharacterized membrane protein HdeD (DUF308 family)